MFQKRLSAAVIAQCFMLASLFASEASAASITWAGHTWNVTTGGMAGGNTGSAGNIVVDASGYLHLKISGSGTTWTCAELFSTDNMGFGTYRWQIDGPVDKLDKNVVLGLFPYGPQAGIGADGTNEIDIEYARWGNSSWDDGNWTIYPNSGSTVGETTFNFSLSSTYTTSSFVWTGTGISFMSQEGIKPLGDSSGLVKKWTYAPSNPTVNIPQRAMPLGMNLWLCSGCGGTPSNGQAVEIIVRSFEFVPLGTSASATAPAYVPKNSAVLSASHGGILLHLSGPAAHDLHVLALDTRGCVVRGGTIAAGARELTIAGVCAGTYVVECPDIGVSRRILVCQ
jgi:hypothetical protein